MISTEKKQHIPLIITVGYGVGARFIASLSVVSLFKIKKTWYQKKLFIVRKMMMTCKYIIFLVCF